MANFIQEGCFAEITTISGPISSDIYSIESISKQPSLVTIILINIEDDSDVKTLLIDVSSEIRIQGLIESLQIRFESDFSKFEASQSVDDDPIQFAMTGIEPIDMNILLQMDDKSLTSACRVNTYISGLCKNDMLWKQRIEIYYPETDIISGKGALSWKEYYVYLSRGKRVSRNSIFTWPTISSEIMLNFLKDANLGPIYNKDGFIIASDFKEALPFLYDPNYYGIVSPGIIMNLMAIYVKFNNLAKADPQFIGVDQTMATAFAENIQTGIDAGQRRLALENAGGGGEGLPRKFGVSGNPLPDHKPLSSGKYCPSNLFFAFDPNNFRWPDLVSVFVTPNMSKTKFHSVNPNADLFFPPNSLPGEQADQIKIYNNYVKAVGLAGDRDVINHLELAMMALGASSYEDDAPLFARAQNDQIMQLILNSRKGMNKYPRIP
jgi:hypothetical protein